MNTVTVYAKLLSGDLYPLQVNPRISLTELQDAVHACLPEDVRPRWAYQVCLLQEEGEEGEEGEELGLQEGDVLSVLLTEKVYDLHLSYMARGQDVEDNPMEAVGYDLYRIEITCPVQHQDVDIRRVIILHGQSFFTTPFRFQEEGVVPTILPVTPLMETWIDDDQEDLENFRLPPTPGQDRSLRVAHFSRPMDELLQGAWSNVPPSARTHLLHLLEALWRDEIRYGPFGAPAYDEDDME